MSFNHQHIGEAGAATTLPESPLVSFAHAVHPISDEAREYANKKALPIALKG